MLLGLWINGLEGILPVGSMLVIRLGLLGEREKLCDGF